MPVPFSQRESCEWHCKNWNGVDETMINLLPFEKAVLDLLLTGENSTLILLKLQLEQSKIVSREFSGSGFFVDFAIDPKFSLSHKPNFTLDDVVATVPEVEYGIGFALFIRSGLITMFEGYTYQEPWAGNCSEFNLSYLRNGLPSLERDFEALKKNLPSL